MSGSIDYTRTLLRLLRDARQNPLVVAGAPWRLGMVPRLFFVIQVVAAILVVGWWLLSALSPLVRATGFEGTWLDTALLGGVLTIVLGGVLAGVFLIPLNLLACASPWRDGPRLSELFLTRMTAREMAFGSIFWGVVSGLAVPVSCVLSGSLPYLVTIIREIIRGSFRFTEVVAALVFVVVVAEVIASSLFVTLWLWFRLGRARWPVLILGPMLCMVGIFVVGGLTTMAVALSEKWMSWNYWSFSSPAVILVVCTSATCCLFRSAGAFAPSLFIRSIDGEPCRNASVLASMVACVRDRDLRHGLSARMRESVPVAIKNNIIVFAACYCLCVVMTVAVSDRHPAGPVWFYSAVVALACSTLYAFHHELRVRGRLALVRDALGVSILRRILPMHGAFLILSFGVGLFAFPIITVGSDRFVGHIIALVFSLLLANISLLAVHVGLLAWVLRPGRLQLLRAGLYVGVPITGLIAVWTMELGFDGHLGFSLGAEREYPTDLAAALIFSVALLRGIPWLQRLHDAVTRHVPIGGVGFIDGRRR